MGATGEKIRRINYLYFKRNNGDMKKKSKDQDPIVAKKTLFVIEIIVVIIGFVLFTQLKNPGVILLFLILMLIIWQIGSRPKKQPYEYLFDKTKQDSVPAYAPDSRFDQPYTPNISEKPKALLVPFTSTSTKTVLYKNFQQAAEYNLGWLNAETQTLQLDPDDDVILSHWTALRIKMKTSFGDSVKAFLMLCIYFGIYGVISYFYTKNVSTSLDARNAAVQAFFFPLFPYILVCYRGLDKYIKALLGTFFLMVTVFIPLSVQGTITADGIPFLKYFMFIREYFPGLIQALFSASGSNSGIEFTKEVLIIIFGFEFILLVITSLFKTRPHISLVISKKALYIRAKTKKSFFEVAKLLLWIILNPFNISQYREIINRVKYNRLTASEGNVHDFSRFTPDSIEKLKIHRHSVKGKTTIAIVLVGIGIATLRLTVGFGLIGIAIILFVKALREKGTSLITLNVKRSKVEGSWILSHQADIFEFDRVPESIAKHFRKISA